MTILNRCFGNNEFWTINSFLTKKIHGVNFKRKHEYSNSGFISFLLNHFTSFYFFCFEEEIIIFQVVEFLSNINNPNQSKVGFTKI